VGFALLRSKGETSARQRRTESFRGRWLIATRPPTTTSVLVTVPAATRLRD
jgi:hypothetical protein